MALAEDALARLADGGERRDQNVVEGLAGGELGTKIDGAGGELLVGQLRDLGLQRVDRDDLRAVGLQPPVVRRPEYLARDFTQHRLLTFPAGFLRTTRDPPIPHRRWSDATLF